MEQVRLNKYISESGICSRREADRLIEVGEVLDENKNPIAMGTKVTRGTIVYVKGQKIGQKRPEIYIALNKPRGITCTTERDIPGNIVDYIGHEERIFPIGRIDKDSQGLILLTNDGDIVNKILRSKNNHEKEYVVRVDKEVTNKFIKSMANGVEIKDGTTKPCKVEKIGTYTFKITLTEGMNRQIRKMCSVFNYRVFKLERQRIMNITIDNIEYGNWRYLTEAEITQIKNQTKDSEKEY